MTDYPISEESFKHEMINLYSLCGKIIRERDPLIYYNKFGKNYTTDEVRKGFNRLADAPPNHSLNAAILRQSIDACVVQKLEKHDAGCEYCDGAGLIQYYKIIADQSYSYSARCHICKSSPYLNIPFYNEIMPHDDIKPHSKPSGMHRQSDDVKSVVRIITGREHENMMDEYKRTQLMKREHAIEQGEL